MVMNNKELLRLISLFRGYYMFWIWIRTSIGFTRVWLPIHS